MSSTTNTTTTQAQTEHTLLAGDETGFVATTTFTDAQEAAYDMYPIGGYVTVSIYKVPKDRIRTTPTYAYSYAVLKDRDENLNDYMVDTWTGYIPQRVPPCRSVLWELIDPDGHEWQTPEIVDGVQYERCVNCNVTRRTHKTHSTDGTDYTEVMYGIRGGDF